jgi:hypothetical protein
MVLAKDSLQIRKKKMVAHFIGFADFYGDLKGEQSRANSQ